ncbi:uncharacterized protein LAESUDRAFT_316775 [Laetiporus sulphureus 93-53]|uniref:Uncharacterized protein n=1 Tax=Laetiporus sulphureus 93-53 TaxID=1314785 RepID=A0A165D416_9APHY|nr:uncharacterized protein LAESUDRAFT_316775 [Laetiporus sulphureus 93-53]KZT04112.1 hypothetical protein LAESUDRAFT_316775 [Laetiporus sulphureus 93-53]
MDTTPRNIDSELSSPLTVPASEHSDLTVPEISIMQPMEGSQPTLPSSDPQILNMPVQISNPSSSTAAGPSGLLLAEAVQFLAKFQSGFSLGLLRTCVILKNTNAGYIIFSIEVLLLLCSCYVIKKTAAQYHQTCAA